MRSRFHKGFDVISTPILKESELAMAQTLQALKAAIKSLIVLGFSKKTERS